MPDNAGYYATRFSYDRKRDMVWSEICRYLQANYISRDGVILEAGAGYCHFINHIAGREKHAVDIFPDLPKFAENGVVAHVQSCTSLAPLADGGIDTVFASNLFEHLERGDLELTLREIRRVLKPGGQLIVLQPNFQYCYRHYFDDYTHIQIFTHTGLADLLASHGFHHVAVKPRFLPFSMKTRLPINRLFLRLYLALPWKPLASQMLIVTEKSATPF